MSGLTSLAWRPCCSIYDTFFQHVSWTGQHSVMNRLIPELDVSDLDRSLAFYVDVVGFRVLYDRPEERFAFLDLDGARLMLEEAAGPGRRFQLRAA